jgi:hypothetical protein
MDEAIQEGVNAVEEESLVLLRSSWEEKYRSSSGVETAFWCSKKTGKRICMTATLAEEQVSTINPSNIDPSTVEYVNDKNEIQKFMIRYQIVKTPVMVRLSGDRIEKIVYDCDVEPDLKQDLFVSDEEVAFEEAIQAFESFDIFTSAKM